MAASSSSMAGSSSSSRGFVVGTKMCEMAGCFRPVFIDPTTKIPHDYCGRTHARQAARAKGVELPAPHGSCHVCQLPGCDEPVFYEEETDRVHEYCCKSHAFEALQLGLRPPSNKGKQGQAPPDQRCSLAGCSAPRFIDPTNGFVHAYCGRSHAKKAEEQGQEAIDVSEAPEVSAVWRGRAGEPPYTISVLTNQHPKYQGIKEQFIASWTAPGPKPTVQRVLQIRNPAPIYERYKSHVAGRREVRHFHGTGMCCGFAINSNQRPCVDKECAVCSIGAQAFSMARAGGGPNAALMPAGLRYGRGLYFSSTSGKSNDYAVSSERRRRGRRWRTLFVCRVAAGHAFCTQEAEHNFTRPPEGCDSVVGEVGPHLNYDELVVYAEAAALPEFLLVISFDH